MPKRLMHLHLAVVSTLLLAAFGVAAQEAKPAKGKGHRDPSEPKDFNYAVPSRAFDVILSRPERNTVTLSLLAYEDLEGYVAYRKQPGGGTLQTPVRRFKKGDPVELVLAGLQADTAYADQFLSRQPGAGYVHDRET